MKSAGSVAYTSWSALFVLPKVKDLVWNPLSMVQPIHLESCRA